MNIKIIGGIISVLIIIVVITLYFLRRNKTEEESETDVVDGEDAETDVVDGEDDDSDGEDDESGVVDEESGLVDEESGLVDEESGLVDEESGLVDEENQPDQQISLDAETDQLAEEERAAEEAAAEQAAEEQARLDEEAAEEQARLDEEAAEEQARLDEEARLAEELAELERIRIAEALLLKMAGANPIAHYVAETYTNNQIWNNSIVGITLDATEWKGNSTVESHTNNGKSFKAIKFELNDGVRFDSSISAPNYTVVTVGRRRSSQGRVINGTSNNVLHGWHGTNTGVFYQGSWMQPMVNSGHGDQWCIMAATNTGLAYVNGKLVHDLNNYSGKTPAQWTINYGAHNQPSQSDIAEMIFYDKHLSKEELVTENERLKKIYGIPTNVAPLGTATQSSTAAGGVASRGIDGNTSNRWIDNGMTYTGNDGWWEVQLDKKYEIAHIKTYQRYTHLSQSVGLAIEIYDGEIKVYDSRVSSPDISTEEKLIYDFVIPIIVGDRVKVIAAANSNNLMLGEVEVMTVL